LRGLNRPDGRDGGRPSVSSHWRTILALGLLGLLLGFGWGIADQPVYRATAGVAVESDSQGSDRARLERFAQRGGSERVATKAAGLLGGDVAGADLLADVEVKPSPKGGAVIVVAKSESPDYAAAAADGYAEAIVKVEGDPLALGSTASIPSAPFENRSAPLSAGIGLLAGLLLGMAVATALTLAERRRRDQPLEPIVSSFGDGVGTEPERDPVADLADRLGAPLLGCVSGADIAIDGGESGTISVAAGRLDDLRSAVTRLGIASGNGPGSIAVMAVGDDAVGAGVATGLSLAAAEAELRVLLVEADVAEPVLHGRLGIAPEPGLCDYVEGAASPRDVLRTVRAEIEDDPAVGFACVPAGRAGPASSIRGHRFTSLVGQLSRVYELVVYTSPPVLAGEEAEGLAELVDAVLLVVGATAEDDDLERAGAALSATAVAGVFACEP
jgi:tyrosine-protein kinase